MFDHPCFHWSSITGKPEVDRQSYYKWHMTHSGHWTPENYPVKLASVFEIRWVDFFTFWYFANNLVYRKHANMDQSMLSLKGYKMCKSKKSHSMREGAPPNAKWYLVKNVTTDNLAHLPKNRSKYIWGEPSNSWQKLSTNTRKAKKWSLDESAGRNLYAQDKNKIRQKRENDTKA